MSYILQSIKLHLGICAINPVISLPIKKAKLSQDLKKHFTARKKTFKSEQSKLLIYQMKKLKECIVEIR